MSKDRQAKTQAAWNASLNYSRTVGPAAVTNAAVEASLKNPTRGTPVLAPVITVVRGDGKVVRVDDRKTYLGEIIEGNIF